jgi:hypothetical protein
MNIFTLKNLSLPLALRLLYHAGSEPADFSLFQTPAASRCRAGTSFFRTPVPFGTAKVEIFSYSAKFILTFFQSVSFVENRLNSALISC